MSEQDQRRLVFHGAIVLLIGNLCGIPLAGAASAGSGEAAMHGWRVAHSGLVATGVLLIAIGAAFRLVVLGEGATSWLVRSLLVAAYGVRGERGGRLRESDRGRAPHPRYAPEPGRGLSSVVGGTLHDPLDDRVQLGSREGRSAIRHP